MATDQPDDLIRNGIVFEQVMLKHGVKCRSSTVCLHILEWGCKVKSERKVGSDTGLLNSCATQRETETEAVFLSHGLSLLFCGSSRMVFYKLAKRHFINQSKTTFQFVHIVRVTSWRRNEIE